MLFWHLIEFFWWRKSSLLSCLKQHKDGFFGKQLGKPATFLLPGNKINSNDLHWILFGISFCLFHFFLAFYLKATKIIFFVWRDQNVNKREVYFLAVFFFNTHDFFWLHLQKHSICFFFSFFLGFHCWNNHMFFVLGVEQSWSGAKCVALIFHA